MGQVPMRALARQVFDGRALRAGDPFNAASESDADDFEAVHMAKREKKPAAPAPTPAPAPAADESAAPAASETQTRDMHAEDSEDDKSDDDKKIASSKHPPRGQYNRRDMKPRR